MSQLMDYMDTACLVAESDVLERICNICDCEGACRHRDPDHEYWAFDEHWPEVYSEENDPDITYGDCGCRCDETDEDGDYIYALGAGCEEQVSDFCLEYNVYRDQNGRIGEIRLLVTTGGPHIEWFLRSRTIKGSWGGDTAEMDLYIDEDVHQKLWDFFSEMG